MFYVIMFILQFFSDVPDSVDVPVTNTLQSECIESVYILRARSETLEELQLDHSIEPSSTLSISFPWGFLRKIILLSEDGTVYSVVNHAIPSNPDTMKIDLSMKEFGRILERVYGSHPLLIGNNSGVSIDSILLIGDSLPPGNLLGCNPLMPSEYVRFWLDTPDPVTFLFYSGGYVSEELSFSTDPDTIYSISNSSFFHNGEFRRTQQGNYSIIVANCISSHDIFTIEVFDEFGYSLLFQNVIENPLGMWDRIQLFTDYPPSFVVCSDEAIRTYSLDRPDSTTGCYEFDLLSLDFDFSFPGGR